MCQTTYDWLFSRVTPLWLKLSVACDRDPWTGAYSVVYPINQTQVVKLVCEEGALDYLERCQREEGPHFPEIHEILHGAIADQQSGQAYAAIRMERLRDPGTVMEGYSGAYARLVSEEQARLEKAGQFPWDDPLSQAKLSAVAAIGLADLLEGGNPTLSVALRRLAELAVTEDWALDLGRADNWMAREDGTVVLSDPVHLTRNFADDLV